MEESRKKPIMIGAIVVCVAVAGAITYMNRSKSSGTIDNIKSGEMIWVKCRNSDCEATYQIDNKVYITYLRENPVGLTTPALVCEKCGEESVYKAVKCEKCGLVFEPGAVPKDFPDRCPECGHSKTEERRKRALRDRGR